MKSRIPPVIPITDLSPEDQRHIDAADGWVGLGDHKSAHKELNSITPRHFGLPQVLSVRFHVYYLRDDWQGAADIAEILTRQLPRDPYWIIQQALALHKLGRIAKAFKLLRPAVAKFPNDQFIPHLLAVYAFPHHQQSAISN